MATTQFQKTFNSILEDTKEAGIVTGVFHSIAVADGLPRTRLGEIILFEGGGVGQAFSLEEDRLEILLLNQFDILVGTKVVRTNKMFEVPIDESLLGKSVSPLDGIDFFDKDKKSYPVNIAPMGILGRKRVEKFFQTGVSMVDLIVPLGRGQRELVIGDRKTGKTEFLMQSVMAHTQNGGICIYAVIGQRQIDILKRHEFFKSQGIADKCVIVGTSSQDRPGLIFLTPFVATTIAEYFRDKGMDVLLILDDMTSHARYYREVSLLARRFPAKASYPGDIFYVQARIVERAGNFEKGSITCLPVAESVSGDLSGYIQTNLMSMTDGHLYFDTELYSQGKRPAINPLLSVTRVGRQTQTTLMKDVGRNLNNFLVKYEKMREYKHFGAEAGEVVRDTLLVGAKLDEFFNQPEYKVIPVNVDLLVVGAIWSNVVDNLDNDGIYKKYIEDAGYKNSIDALIAKADSFEGLVRLIKENPSLCLTKAK